MAKGDTITVTMVTTGTDRVVREMKITTPGRRFETRYARRGDFGWYDVTEVTRNGVSVGHRRSFRVDLIVSVVEVLTPRAVHKAKAKAKREGA